MTEAAVDMDGGSCIGESYKSGEKTEKIDRYDIGVVNGGYINDQEIKYDNDEDILRQ